MIRELIALSVIVGILLFTALMLLLTGCTGNAIDINEIHDERATIGCVVVSVNGKTSYVAAAEGELCKVFCSESEQLPDGFTFEYDRNGCKIQIGDNHE